MKTFYEAFFCLGHAFRLADIKDYDDVEITIDFKTMRDKAVFEQVLRASASEPYTYSEQTALYNGSCFGLKFKLTTREQHWKPRYHW